MKHTTHLLLTAALILVMASAANAQDFGPGNGNGNGVCQFIDEDGDGFNDLAPDADGDGIPNGQDPDYVKPGDGTGNQYNWAQANGNLWTRMFGEGMVKATKGEGQGHYGPGDGTGECIGDGTGGGAFGPGSGTGTGEPSPAGDGTGTQERRAGRR